MWLVRGEVGLLVVMSRHHCAPPRLQCLLRLRPSVVNGNNRDTTPETGMLMNSDGNMACLVYIFVFISAVDDKAFRCAFQLTNGEATSRFEGLAALKMTPK